MLRFIITHPRVLAFGLLLTLFSSFGQTFLISIFVPRILTSFALGAGEFGMLYAAATVTSALCLPFFGRLIDRVPLRHFSLAVGGSDWQWRVSAWPCRATCRCCFYPFWVCV